MAKSKLNKLLTLVETTTTEAPVEKQFISDLTYSIERTDASVVRKPSKTFKPSSIGSCPRSIYYQLIGATPDEEQRSSSTLVGICESGTDRHIRIQQAIADMKKNDIDCEYVDVEEFINAHGLADEIKVVSKSIMETKCYSPKYNVSFLTDGIIKYKGKYYILEIKTMGTQKYIESKQVRQEHTAQGTLYCLLFHLNSVLYLYEDRQMLNKKAFLYEVTEDMKQELVDKMNYINDCVQKQTPPEVPEFKKCTYCTYINLCNLDKN